ncbi:sensor histidine kinase [Streptomyces sp. NPDC017979]|uniref:sensor histidine kinase n=1 Tax=Streptomyces sp. NPDC017979 TaxID=3365024 RepID=UPI0037AEE091
MSFRLRVVGLLVVVAVVAAASSATLTWRQAKDEFKRNTTADMALIDSIADSLKDYAFSHGTWTGVGPRVLRLSDDTGHRIRVSIGKDVLVADSDVLRGRSPRSISPRPAATVDPMPRMVLTYDRTSIARADRTLAQIADYETTVHMLTCLSTIGHPLKAAPDKFGNPVLLEGWVYEEKCHTAVERMRARPDALVSPKDRKVAFQCLGLDPKARERLNDCLQEAFRKGVQDVAPPRLDVYVGEGNTPPFRLSTAPVAGLAAGVAVVVALAAILLTRTVLRPVRTLTAATSSLGQGDLGRRVPVEGRDEIARLGRAFNRMAGSIQAGEERQRRLTGDVAHELRTPLANIRGYVEAFQDGYLEPTPELLASLHEEVMLQQRIVDDLQDLALAEAGALTYHFSAVDLGELLETCRVAHRARAEEAGVRLEVSVGARAVAVCADPYRLRQAVGNLVSNAVRATPPGGAVTLELAEDGERALVRVRDTGAGIPQEHLPHLFDRFWRGDASRGRRTGGSGLGLSIVRQIVRDHGGWVDVTSTVGAGTTFTVTLESL